MIQRLPPVTYPSIKHLLLDRLQVVLDLYVSDSSVLNQRNRQISLHRSKDNRRVLYVWAIALQLSKAKNIPALEIATTLASLLRKVGANSGTAISCEFTVHVIPPGWIHLELTEPKLAAWLQHLAQGELGELREQGKHVKNPYSPLAPRPSSSRLFAVQYAHARCCSLVQMAHREGLITLLSSPTPPTLFRAVAPDPIPWLNFDQIRLCHPTERALIVQLLGLLDDFYCPCPILQSIDWEKAALNLSQAFQAFYSCCRIWGEVKIQTIHLAQARLGLIMATQQILRLLLQDRLGVYAPVEL